MDEKKNYSKGAEVYKYFAKYERKKLFTLAKCHYGVQYVNPKFEFEDNDDLVHEYLIKSKYIFC